MATLVEEKDIRQSECLAAQVNQAVRWHNEIAYLLDTKQTNSQVEITFETLNGTKLVRTQVKDLVVNYVRIGSGIFIPLSSISDITLTPVSGTTTANADRFYAIIIISFLLLVVLYVCMLIMRS